MDKVENKALRDYIYEKIRELIENEEISSGEKINKSLLGKRFNVSATPINDALSRLEGERYIEQRSRKGFYVREIAGPEYAELWEMRAGLEGVAARLCCEKATDEELEQIIHLFDRFVLPIDDKEILKQYMIADREFHFKTLEYAKNKEIFVAMNKLGFFNRAYLLKTPIRPPEKTLPEHKALIETYRHRDGHAACRLMMEHFFVARDLFVPHKH